MMWQYIVVAKCLQLEYLSVDALCSESEHASQTQLYLYQASGWHGCKRVVHMLIN